MGEGLVGGIVVEIALDIDDGGALVAAAGGQVTQGTDEIGKVAGGSTLGDHVAHQGDLGILLTDLLGNGLLQGIALEIGKVLVGQVLQLQLIGGTDEAAGVAGGYYI